LINFINNDRERNPERNDGHIFEKEYAAAFTDKNISNDSYKFTFEISEKNHLFLSRLAQTFGLAYRNERGQFLIFPICLPENYPDSASGLGEAGKSDFFMEITTSNTRSTTSPVKFPKDIIPAFIVKRHNNLDYIGKKAYCSSKGAVLKWNTIRAEVKKTEDSKIVVLVRGKNTESCEFGVGLICDLYEIIQNYKVFQEKQTKPVIKVWFTDKRGRDQSFEIDEIPEIMEDESLVKNIVEPDVWERLKMISRKFAEKGHFKGKFGLGLKFGPAKVDAEVEAGLGAEAEENE